MNKSSPIPQFFPEHKPKQMSFGQALKEITEGKKVTRLEWKNKSLYGFMEKDISKLHLADGNHLWTVNKADILSNDWVIV